ncbi:MAG: diacylglycerol kinase (ATP) [Bacteroidia bacterium]|jgi:diacylglycerol kinase (ATP)
MKRILFIINPISGGKKKDHLPHLIEKHLDHSRFHSEIFHWTSYPKLRTRLGQFVEDSGNIVVAVGGDGTINIIASLMYGTQTTLGVVPMGSGNGFARALKIPLNPADAILALNDAEERMLDVWICNTSSFVNVAGIGFDATVSQRYKSFKKRGLLSYAKSVLLIYPSAKEYTFNITLDGQKYCYKGFMLSVANGPQWGNNFTIAPCARFDDGLLDLIIVRKPKLWQIISLLRAFRNGNKSQNGISLRGKSIQIHSESNIHLHLDGEASGTNTDFRFELEDKKLRVLQPSALQ